MTLEGPNRRANYARDVIGIRGTPADIPLKVFPLARRTGYGIRRDNLTKSQRGGLKSKETDYRGKLDSREGNSPKGEVRSRK